MSAQARKWVPHPWHVFVFAPGVGEYEPQFAVDGYSRAEGTE